MTVDPRLVRAVRAQLEQRPKAARVGWKVGAGEGERIGSEPIAVGHLTSATVLSDGSTYAGGGGDLHADAELAVEIAGDGAVSGYAVALELVDLAAAGGAEEVVASNIFHRAVAFGRFAGTCPSPLRARIVVNGDERAEATAPDDVVARVAQVARVLDAVDESLELGDRVITGSIVQVRVAGGHDVVAEIDGLRSVRLGVV